MFFDSMSIMAYVLGLIFIYVICRIFIKPLKILIKLIINGVLGGLMLAAVNLLGGLLGVTIVINPLSSLIAGLLGVPGVILLVLLRWLL